MSPSILRRSNYWWKNPRERRSSKLINVPRRILLLITDLEIGGTPTVVRELAIRLRNPPEVEIEVASLSKWGLVADQLRDARVYVTALRARGARDLFVTV